MHRILISLILIVLGLFSRDVLAWDCTTITTLTTVSPQNVTISRGLAVGSVIGTQVISPTINAYSCRDSDQGTITNQIFGVKAIGTYVTTINNRRIYKTEVDGVGYSISGTTTKCAGGTGVVSGSNTMRGLADTVKLCENTSGMVNSSLNGSITVTFYKTASETGSGTVTGKTVGSLVLLNNALLWQSPEAVVNINAFTVTTPACTLTTSFIPVDMKDVNKNEFNGKNSTPGSNYTQSFNLPMTCNAGTQVKVKMEGDIYDSAKGIINTTGETGTATGVGIQLLYNSQPLTLGTDVPVGTSSAGGSFSVPLQARYYQIGNTITTGKANGVLTFTMTYQ